jgi:aminopeptidase N
VERIFSSLYSYNKGAWALHQLRLQLGDSSFFKAIRNYLNDTRLSYNFSHTALLREHFEAQYGQSLKNYFAIWVEQKEIPAYQVYWWQEDNGEVSIRVLMNTKNDTIANCTLPLPFEWSEQWDGKADSSFIIKPQFADQVFHFKTSKKLKRVSLDPNANILATINCEQQAVSGMQAATKIQVLPNPASDFIYINAQANSLVSVYFYSLDGKLVAMQNLEKNATLLGITKCSIQALPVGFYVIRMVSSEGNNYFSELLKK